MVKSPYRWCRSAALLLSTLMALTLTALPADAALSNTPDDTWMTNGTVYALIKSGPWVYIGGKFTRVRQEPPGVPGKGFAASNVARIDAATGIGDRTWTPDVTCAACTSVVYALAAAGGKIWVGGKFDAVDGQPRLNLAAIGEADGVVDPAVAPSVGTSTSHIVRALTTNGSLVYAGGAFIEVNGIARIHLAAFHLDGSLDATWRSRAGGLVRTLGLDCTGSTVFAGGVFERAAGSARPLEPRDSVARFDVTTGALHPWSIPDAALQNGLVAYDLAASCDRLVVGFGGQNFVYSFDLIDDVGDVMWLHRTAGNVQAVTLLGDQVVFGGHFSQVDHDRRIRIAAAAAADGTLNPDWHPDIDGKFYGPWDLLAEDAHLWVGGQFTLVGGVPQYFLARFTF